VGLAMSPLDYPTSFNEGFHRFLSPVIAVLG
jgi:hypothetical protein